MALLGILILLELQHYAIINSIRVGHPCVYKTCLQFVVESSVFILPSIYLSVGMTYRKVEDVSHLDTSILLFWTDC